MVSKRTIVTALNIMDGLGISGDDKKFDSIKKAYESHGFGFVEFTGWIADVAVALEAAYDKACLSHRGPTHGVFDYEVPYWIGTVIFMRSRENGELPSETLLGEVYAEAIHAFLTKVPPSACCPSPAQVHSAPLSPT